MIKYLYNVISSTANFIIGLKNLSISQWDVEHDESIVLSNNLRQKR